MSNLSALGGQVSDVGGVDAQEEPTPRIALAAGRFEIGQRIAVQVQVEPRPRRGRPGRGYGLASLFAARQRLVVRRRVFGRFEPPPLRAAQIPAETRFRTGRRSDCPAREGSSSRTDSVWS